MVPPWRSDTRTRAGCKDLGFKSHLGNLSCAVCSMMYELIIPCEVKLGSAASLFEDWLGNPVLLDIESFCSCHLHSSMKHADKKLHDVRGVGGQRSDKGRVHTTGSLLIRYKSVPFPSRLHCTGIVSKQCRYEAIPDHFTSCKRMADP